MKGHTIALLLLLCGILPASVYSQTGVPDLSGTWKGPRRRRCRAPDRRRYRALVRRGNAAGLQAQRDSERALAPAPSGSPARRLRSRNHDRAAGLKIAFQRAAPGIRASLFPSYPGQNSAHTEIRHTSTAEGTAPVPAYTAHSLQTPAGGSIEELFAIVRIAGVALYL